MWYIYKDDEGPGQSHPTRWSAAGLKPHWADPEWALFPGRRYLLWLSSDSACRVGIPRTPPRALDCIVSEFIPFPLTFLAMGKWAMQNKPPLGSNQLSRPCSVHYRQECKSTSKSQRVRFFFLTWGSFGYRMLLKPRQVLTYGANFTCTQPHACFCCAVLRSPVCLCLSACAVVPHSSAVTLSPLLLNQGQVPWSHQPTREESHTTLLSWLHICTIKDITE